MEAKVFQVCLNDGEIMRSIFFFPVEMRRKIVQFHLEVHLSFFLIFIATTKIYSRYIDICFFYSSFSRYVHFYSSFNF